MAAARPVTPLLTWMICVAAVFPFALSAGLFAFGPPNLAGPALLWLTTYAVVVTSFIGGHRWGLEVQSRGNAFLLLAAIAPALIAWSVLVLPPQTVTSFRGLTILLVLTVVTWVWDVLTAELPGWYKPMRTVMAIGAAATLALGAWKAAQLGI